MNATLLNNIRTELSRLTIGRSNIYRYRRAIDKLYEIYILSCVTQSLRHLGCTLEARDNSGRATGHFEFRLAPSYLFSQTTSSSFIHITYRSKEYELHNGVRVLGRSNILHELDVVIIDGIEANRCRQNGIHPKQGKVKFLAECKYYGEGLPLRIGREFLGLCSEFNVRVKTIASNVESDSIHKLLTSHGQTENFDLTPLQQTKIDIFIKWMANELRQVL